MFDRLSLLWKRFSPLEERLLGEARTALPAAAREIFDARPCRGRGPSLSLRGDGPAEVALLADPLGASEARQPEALAPAWRRILGRHQGRQPSGWLVHGEMTTYRLALSDAEYLVLAERDGDEFLLGQVDNADTGLFHLESHDEAPKPFDHDVEALLAGPKARSVSG
jgi:hypothetical protein